MKVNDRKDEILAAAKIHFSKYGFDKTSLEEVGKTASLNKATFYYYYKNKADLYHQVIDAESDTLVSELQAQILLADTQDDQIVSFLKARIQAYNDRPLLHQLSLASLTTGHTFFDVLYQMAKQKELDMLIWLLDEGSTKGYYRNENMPAIAEHLLLMCDAYYFQTIRYHDPETSEKPEMSAAISKIGQFTQLILRGIQP